MQLKYFFNLVCFNNEEKPDHHSSPLRALTASQLFNAAVESSAAVEDEPVKQNCGRNMTQRSKCKNR